jgi:hypothetical protein
MAAAPAGAAAPRIPTERPEQLIPGPVKPTQFENIFRRFKATFPERDFGPADSWTLVDQTRGVTGSR